MMLRRTFLSCIIIVLADIMVVAYAVPAAGTVFPAVPPSDDAIARAQLSVERHIIRAGCEDPSAGLGCCRRVVDADGSSIKLSPEQVERRGDALGVLVRLSFHDAGSYRTIDGLGGGNGCLLQGHSSNGGLDPIITDLQSIYPDDTVMSRADFWAFAANVALWCGLPHNGGIPLVLPSSGLEIGDNPENRVNIPFAWGRRDASNCTVETRLPDAEQSFGHVRDYAHAVGLTTQDITALMGAHTLGRLEANHSGYEGQWVHQPAVADGSEYYRSIIDIPWSRASNADGTKHFWVVPQDHASFSGDSSQQPSYNREEETSIGHHNHDDEDSDHDLHHHEEGSSSDDGVPSLRRRADDHVPSLPHDDHDDRDSGYDAKAQDDHDGGWGWRKEGPEPVERRPLIMLNTDMALAYDIGTDADVNTRTCNTVPVPRTGPVPAPGPGHCNVQDSNLPLVRAYAESNLVWLDDFLVAWQKLQNLGMADAAEPPHHPAPTAPTGALESSEDLYTKIVDMLTGWMKTELWSVVSSGGH